MAISKDEILRIKSKANIIEILSAYYGIEFKKSGENMMCRCPFHGRDNHPSMSVSEKFQYYHCFTCGKKGNIFDFITEMEGISFPENVKRVAEIIGETLNGTIDTSLKYQKYFDAVKFAVEYYEYNLRTTKGDAAKKYLLSRNIDENIIKEFQIGYANDSMDDLSKMLLKKGFDESLLFDVGLVGNGNNGIYDMFRNRITFPIHDIRGNPVGFSARRFDEAKEQKYINTKSTEIFVKGNILFNYHRAISEARKSKYLIIVEGQMDAIRVYASGLKNVVATMGVALTSYHINLLKKLGVKIVLCFDNDNAGVSAALDTGSELSKEKIDVAILKLNNEGNVKDPDEYILKNGIESFEEAVNLAPSYFEFKKNYIRSNVNIKDIKDKKNYIESVIKELNKENDSLLAELEITKLSEEFDIPKFTLYEMLNNKDNIQNQEVIKKIEKKKRKKEEKLCELIIFFLMSDEKYIKAYQEKLSYLPIEKYNTIAEDILAFFIKYNYINIADFIVYSVEEDYYDLLTEINDEYMNLDNHEDELTDNDFIGAMDKINNVIIENDIIKLKEDIKLSSDINEQIKLANEITKLKKRMCEDEESSRN